jgi:hypothetical protein
VMTRAIARLFESGDHFATVTFWIRGIVA